MVPLSYYLVLSAIPVRLRRCRISDQAQHHHHLHVDRADAERREPFVRRLRGTQLNKLDGHIFVFFVMVVAAAEAAVGLAIIIAVFRTRETLNVDRVNLLDYEHAPLAHSAASALAGAAINGCSASAFPRRW
jgi:NADH-quinone oxidoreductase subunit K